MSLTVSGGQSLGNADNRPALSGDGRFVAFASAATDMLGAGLDTNNNPDIFVRDRAAATTSRVSVGAGGVEANNASLVPVDQRRRTLRRLPVGRDESRRR